MIASVSLTGHVTNNGGRLARSITRENGVGKVYRLPAASIVETITPLDVCTDERGKRHSSVGVVSQIESRGSSGAETMVTVVWLVIWGIAAIMGVGGADGVATNGVEIAAVGGAVAVLLGAGIVDGVGAG